MRVNQNPTDKWYEHVFDGQEIRETECNKVSTQMFLHLLVASHSEFVTGLNSASAVRLMQDNIVHVEVTHSEKWRIVHMLVVSKNENL